MSYQALEYPGMAIRDGERYVGDRVQFYRRLDFEGRCVLGLGCAEGSDEVWIARNFNPSHVVGVDVNPVAINEAHDLAEVWKVQDKTVFLCMSALLFLLWEKHDPRLNGCTLILNSVSRWIGPEKLLKLVSMFDSRVVYCESHSEGDCWTVHLLAGLMAMGFKNELLATLPYTMKDSRPVRKFYRCEKV